MSSKVAKYALIPAAGHLGALLCICCASSRLPWAAYGW